MSFQDTPRLWDGTGPVGPAHAAALGGGAV